MSTVTDNYGLNWTAVHVIHSDLILGPMHQSSIISTIFFGAFLGLVLGAGLPLAWWVTRPLWSLSARMSNLEHLNFDGIIGLKIRLKKEKRTGRTAVPYDEPHDSHLSAWLAWSGANDKAGAVALADGTLMVAPPSCERLKQG